jgi:hypothetical protein
VKPRHSIDAVVVGYSTTERGIRDVLLSWHCAKEN